MPGLRHAARPYARPVLGLLSAGGLLLSLAACAAAGPGDQADPAQASATPSAAAPASACNYDETVGAVRVTGTAGQKPTITVDPAGAKKVESLVVRDLCDGSGTEVATNATVTADYAGVALSTGKEFDASYGSGPATFGLDQVIAGWSQGLPGMQVGGTRLLIIPGDLAYGAQSPTPLIGPDESLIFVVDMVAAQ